MGGDERVEAAAVVVVMVAFPAQSHMNQLLQLSYLLSSYNIPVHYAGSALHNHLLRLRAPTSFEQVHFHDFPLPPFSAPDPDPSAHHFPAHLYPSFNASMHLRELVFNLCTQLASGSRRLVIIFDQLMGYVVQDAAAALANAEAYVFRAISSFTAFFSDWETKGKPFQEEIQVPDGGLPTMEDCFTRDVMEFLVFQSQFLKFRSGDLRNTSRLIEGTYLDLQDRIGDGKKQWAIGPLHVQLANRVHGTNQHQNHRCLKWLDKQPPKSVILVAFGSLTTLLEEQIVEIGRGLEESKARFLWVLRDADRGDASVAASSGAVVQGFEERVGPLGMVVTDWAPQIQILAHPATGGFMTHCGWNSCLESISAGVPVAAWPMHSDQPRNAMLMTQVLRVGLLVRDWNNRREIVKASVISEAVMKLMGSKEGEGMRNRAEELGRVVNQGADEGGVSRIQLESFIAHIRRNENVLK